MVQTRQQPTMAKCNQILKTGKRANDRANRAIKKQEDIVAKGEILKRKFADAQAAVVKGLDGERECRAEKKQMMAKLMAKQKSDRKDLDAQYKAKLRTVRAKTVSATKDRAKLWAEGKALTKKYEKIDKQAAAAQDKAQSFMMKHKECKLQPVTRKRRSLAKFPTKPPAK